MNGSASTRGAAAAALKVAMVAAMLLLAAGVSQADPGGGRGSGRGGGAQGRVGDRGYSGGSPRAYARGGDRGDGGRAYRGGGGGRSSGGGRAWVGGGGSFPGPVAGIRGGGSRAYGGVRYYRGGRYSYRPYGYRFYRPRTFVRFGIGWGSPYYYEPVPYPVAVGPGASIDVTNLPPEGCYYYDPFCDRQFVDLDDYTDHLESIDHARTIEVVQRDSGERLWTLELAGGAWRVAP